MKVLVLGAGGPAGVNTCRALYEAGHEVLAWDEQRDHLRFTVPYAEESLGLDHSVDAVIAQPDRLVMWLSDCRKTMPPAFLPSAQTIALCQDKFECGLAWRRAGLRSEPIQLVDSYPIKLPPAPFWFRARYGAGAKTAIRARSTDDARHWWNFWALRIPQAEFVAEGFLPGRDFSWCGIYYEGELQASFARERLEYMYPQLTPEGLTGTPTRAVITKDPAVTVGAQTAVEAIDDKPHGIFCVDMCEDEEGVPRPTEINAGRFSTTVGLWSIYSERSNFVALAAELAVGDRSRLEGWEELPEGLELSRHIDCGYIFSGVSVMA